jgi:purine-binding chemotaxis protein CheW
MDQVFFEGELDSEWSSEEPSTIVEYLAFLIDGEPYAVPLGSVQEIVTARKLTRVPRAPEDVLGICAVRGELVTVLDTRKRLKRGTSNGERGRILLTQSNAGEKVGLWVDEVLGVERFAAESIEPVAGNLSLEPGSHTEGIGRDQERVVVLLNLSTLTA